jgi:peptide/nickel transport system substrate-binding protein
VAYFGARALWAGPAQAPSATPAAPGSAYRPGPVEADVFHPAHQPGADGKRPALPAPAFGGRAVIHLERLPRSLNNVLENLGVLRRMMLELNETLLLRDWETLELGPDLATSWVVEDALHVVPSGAASPGASVLVKDEELVRGRLSPLGEGWQVETRGPDGATRTQAYDKARVKRVERGTVVTFTLREGVRWHDGHPFDARDVRFSIELYKNPYVDCGEKRNQFDKIVAVETPDARTVRVWFDRQYYFAVEGLGTELTILPAHLYDLRHPDNAERQARKAKEPAWEPDEKQSAEYIAKNEHNRAWVGLGPYRVTRFDDQGVQAERFDGYFDPAHGGYLDELVWRYIKDDAVALQALLNGELDFFARVSAEDYFGALTRGEGFQKRFYKGHFYSGNYWFVAWNLQRPKLADVRVRRALALATDFEGFKHSFYKDLADQITGPWILAKPEYDQDVRPLPFAPDQARKLLEEAGWIDRDGDGVLDHDGVPLEIELLCDAGNAVIKTFGAQWQQDLAKVGVRLRLALVDAAVAGDRRKARDFDAVASAWALTFENDPEQVWHSKWAAPEARGSNFGGFADARCDELIERGQRELDPAKRAALWRELHARIYELQPYLFGYSPPRKFAHRPGPARRAARADGSQLRAAALVQARRHARTRATRERR